MLQIGGSFFGICSTIGSTATKIVSDCPGFVLYNGASIYVKFTETNSASVATLKLNVNGTGAYSIKRYGSTNLTDTGAIVAGCICNFVYDGSYWQWVGQMNTDTNTVPSAYCETVSSNAAKVATCTGFTLQDNSYVYVTFAAGNSSAGAITLNINGTGAQQVRINGNVTGQSNYTLPAGSYLTYYDGTSYQFRTDGVLPGVIAGNIVSITNDGPNIIYTMGDGTTAGFAVPHTTYTAGSSISINNDVITNTGVRAINQGTENGTISVNTGGTTRNVSVKGLGSAAYEASTAFASSGHTHGNINNIGEVSGNGVNPAVGDVILVADASNSNKLVKTTIEFDGTTENKFLSQAGTWESVSVAGSTTEALHAGTANFASSANYARTASAAITASAALSAGSAAYATTASNAQNAGEAIHAASAIYAMTAAYAATAAPSINGVYYGVCDTAQVTKAKTVTLTNGTNFKLALGCMVAIKFTYASTAATMTLNINGTGAKNLCLYGTSAMSSGTNTNGWRAGAIVMFVYDGKQWERVFWENSTYYVESVYISTAAGTAAKVGTSSNYTLEAGKYFQVLVVNANTVQSALTLNISSKGAKPIYINGAASSTSNYTLPSGYYLVYYDGTNYYFRTDDYITGNITGQAGSANYATSATYATHAASAGYATRSASAGYATHAASAVYASSATTASNAVYAGSTGNATEAVHAASATYAASAGEANTANSSNTSGTAAWAITANRAIYAYSATYVTTAQNAVHASTAAYAASALTASYSVTATDAKHATTANYAATAYYAVTAGNAVNALKATQDSKGKTIDTEYVHVSDFNTKLAATDAMQYKGTLGTGGTITALPATHSKGDTYKIITAGTYAGVKCELGDMVICLNDGTTDTSNDWTVVQANLDGAVIGPASVTDGQIAVFDGTTGKLIKAATKSTGTVVTGLTWSAGSATTTSNVTADDITTWTPNAIPTATVSNGVLIFYAGTTATLAWSDKSFKAVNAAGSAPTLSWATATFVKSIA